MGASDESTTEFERDESLNRVLGHSLHAKALAEECADDLASVNGAMAQALAANGETPVFVGVLGQTAALSAKVQAVSVALAVANRMLEVAIRDRTMNDLRFAAAEEQEQSARYAALHDVLTGLPNRALFNDRLDHGIAQARRHEWTLAVMFVDLDDFKVINDTHGHQTGDAVLRLVADAMRTSVRIADVVGRLGGDEFAVLMPETDAPLADAAAKRLVASLRNVFKGTPNVTASIGVVACTATEASTDDLLRRADQAMYDAKRAGKDRVVQVAV